MIRKGRRKPNPSYWLTPREVAELVGCHYNTVYNWLHRDGLSHERNENGFIRIRKTDLQELLDEYYPGLQI
jgi:excisionase family DNA binding protein